MCYILSHMHHHLRAPVHASCSFGRLQVAGKVQTGYILLWNFSDPIHPQYVLEAPGDVYCFRFCPNNPDVVVGGVSSGQVIVRAASHCGQCLHHKAWRPPAVDMSVDTPDACTTRHQKACQSCITRHSGHRQSIRQSIRPMLEVVRRPRVGVVWGS